MADNKKVEVTNDLPKAIDDLIGRRGGKNRLRVGTFKSEALAMSKVRDRLSAAYAQYDNPKTARNLSRIAQGKSAMRRAPSGMPKGAAAEWTNEEKMGYRKGISREPRYRVGLISEKGAKTNDPNNPYTWTFLEYGTKFQPARRVLLNVFKSMQGSTLSRFTGGMKHYISEAIQALDARAQRAAARAAKKAGK